ncbi:hypothetical protein [Desulfopila sp. IMCC35008]|uniref:hypothetical protein n=1 Tax=Desulfopila sp. IMCC35008 TaxID=2653858 RepID=UPI0013D29AEA|nr:hypothetical protein [Desulfopila sp. IMCC35008]
MKRRLFCSSGLCLLVFGSVSVTLSGASTTQSGALLMSSQVSVTGENSPGFLPDLDKRARLKQPEALKLAVRDISFTCQQGCCGHYYDHCDLHIHYHAHLEEGMNLPVAMAVTCDGAIEYKTEGGDLLINESEPVTVHRTMLTETRDDAYVSLDFPFSYYEGVVEAQLTFVKCRIDRENLYSAATGDE